MTLPTSGALSLNDIHIEAGGATGTLCTIDDTDIRGLTPGSGQTINATPGTNIDFADFYGASLFQPYTIYDGSANTVPSELSKTTISVGTQAIGGSGSAASSLGSGGFSVPYRILMFGGWTSAGSAWVYARAWNYRLTLDVSALPTTCRAGKIRVQWYQMYNDGSQYTPAGRYYGRLEYIRSTGTTTNLFSPTDTVGGGKLSNGDSLPNDYSYGRIDGTDDFDFGYFVSADTVQDYIDAGRDFQIVIRHTGPDNAGGRWEDFNGQVGQEIAIKEFEIVDPSTTTENVYANTIA
jgi:hypothetical protein